MLIKTCGITDKTNVTSLKGHVDMLGFIFYELSPRNAFNTPGFFIRHARQHFKTVGVFVDHPIEDLISLYSNLDLEYVQLHGHEDIAYIKKLKERNIKIIKAINIKPDIDKIDFKNKIHQYDGLIDLMVLDASGKNRGGNGKKFNWEILKWYDTNSPYLLSGGITSDDADVIKKMSEDNPCLQGVDINSCFEISPGHKDTDLIINFSEKLKEREK